MYFNLILLWFSVFDGGVLPEENDPNPVETSEPDCFNMSQLSESLEPQTDASAKLDCFNLSQLNESLDTSLQSGIELQTIIIFLLVSYCNFF